MPAITQRTVAMRAARQFTLACLIVTLFLSIGGVASVQAASFVVANTNDVGPGSLRDAITQANASPGATISFAITGGGAQTINVLTSLPTITGTVTVDGTTEPGYAGAPLVTLDGGNRLITTFTVGTGATLDLTGLVIQRSGAGGITNAGTLTMTNTTLVNNFTSHGGAINNTGILVISGCTFQSNIADQGAALYTTGGATITNSLFTQNIAANFGGAIGIFGSTVTITGTTFSANSAGSDGGAITVSVLVGPPVTAGMLYLSNSTVSGNSTAFLGGGVFLNSSSSATFLNDTVTGNSVGNGGNGGGIYKYASATATLANTIVANNTAPGGGGPDVFGPFSDGGHNLIRETDGSTGFTDVTGGGTDYTGTTAAPRDPGLAALPLASNGGPTPTEALLPTSVAIDHGDNTICTIVTGPAPVGGKDQRGVLRPQGPVCDIGAFEYLVFTLNGTTIPTSGGAVTLTGTGFQPGLTLTVDGVNAPVTAVAPNGTALTATLPAHLPGTVAASASELVFAPAPATTTLTYVNFTPAVQSISLPSGPVTGGASVTITGAYFAPGASVAFGNIPARNVTVVSDTKITATTPPQSASGAVNVGVTVQGLVGTLTNGYTYGTVIPVPPPQPTVAPVSGTTPLPVARTAGQSSGGSPPAPLPAPRP